MRRNIGLVFQETTLDNYLTADGRYVCIVAGSDANFARLCAAMGRPELATVVLAVIRGLVMDLEATADTPRIDEAFNHFIGALRTWLAPPAERLTNQDTGETGTPGRPAAVGERAP